ncbi:MAG: CotH kinase family protein [Flavobacteriales bacterium]|nr:CotH kinase family protein [Flavobacteriales bacterium]
MKNKYFQYALYLFLFIAGYFLHKSGIINEGYQVYVASRIHKENRELAEQTDAHTIKLILSKSDIKKLEAQRVLAMEVGQYYKDDKRFTGYLKGGLEFEGNESKIKLRQKGLFEDHFKDPLKASYKIKLENGVSVLGMEKFAIQHPKTRGHLNEWYLHQFFRYEGLIALRYNFVEVYINDRDAGVYALEENMHKNLLENNKRKPGPILRFDVEGEGPIFSHKISAYNLKELKKDTFMKSQFKRAKQMLKDFRKGTKRASDIFDIESFAKFYALIDLTGHHHASHVFNLKFYYNPVSELIEPIGYDNSSFSNIKEEGLLGSEKTVDAPLKNRGEIVWKNDPFTERIFNDGEFFKQYVNNLTAYSKTTWLDAFFEQNADAAQEKMGILYKSYPFYIFEGKEILYSNQVWINNMLTDCVSPKVKKKIVNLGNGNGSLILRNQNKLPLEIVSVNVNGVDVELGAKLLQPYYAKEMPSFDSIEIKTASKEIISIETFYRFLGTSQIQSKTYDCKMKSIDKEN